MEYNKMFDGVFYFAVFSKTIELFVVFVVSSRFKMLESHHSVILL